MFGFFYPVMILQALCLFHAYRKHSEQKWYWIIIFFPLVGCLVYIFENFYNRSTINTITESVKEVVISNYRLEQLEKAVKFSDNVRNKTNLAEAYIQNSRFAEAIALYESCLHGFMADDPMLKIKLLHAFFLDKQFDRCVGLGQELSGDKNFSNAEERISFAWALHYSGKGTEAERNFEEMDRSFTNYNHRHSYCLFLNAIGKPDEAKSKVAELLDEINHMKMPERRMHRTIINEIRGLKEVK